MAARSSLVHLIGLLATCTTTAGVAAAQDRPAPATAEGSVERDASPAPLRRRLPQGYLGISFTCSVKRLYGPEGLTIYHYGYPAVASVEPGSPAEHAGIVAGDTIVAYDSQDVLYRKIVLAKLLSPGRRLNVRVRRNGTTKDLAVRIVDRPQTFVDMSVRGQHDDLPPLPRLPGPSRGAGDSPDPGLVIAPIGGAEVVRVTADLRDALGVPGGLLVITVDDDTPAADAGIKAGDVIIGADGQSLEAPMHLSQLVQSAESADRTLTLRVVRRHHERTVVLK